MTCLTNWCTGCSIVLHCPTYIIWQKDPRIARIWLSRATWDHHTTRQRTFHIYTGRYRFDKAPVFPTTTAHTRHPLSCPMEEAHADTHPTALEAIWRTFARFPCIGSPLPTFIRVYGADIRVPFLPFALRSASPDPHANAYAHTHPPPPRAGPLRPQAGAGVQDKYNPTQQLWGGPI